MTIFDDAFAYVLQNEGGDSNDAADKGGRTRFGITAEVAQQNGYDVTKLTLDQAKDIYRKRYWLFDGLRERRLAMKLFDVVVNFGIVGGVKIIQRAVGVQADGIWGTQTEAAIARMNTEDVIEKVSQSASDHYVDICIANQTQMVFLKGWERRVIRRPPITVIV